MSTNVSDWTVKSMLEWATDYFKEKNIPDPRHSIEWLLAEILDIKRLDLYLNFDRPLSPSELDKLRPLVKRRAAHEPLQYIIGYSEFMNAHINVNPDVLIPRIETEQLTELILNNYPSDSQLRLLDIGTGSGCIPIVLKMKRPGWTVYAFDISGNALKLARKNAETNKTNITFAKGDINTPHTLPFDCKFEVIVSNPPYIEPEQKETMQSQVKDHEPGTALFTDNINQLYTNIIQYAAENLTDNGSLYLEINERHGKMITNLFSSNTWDISLLKDYQDKDRFICANLR